MYILHWSSDWKVWHFWILKTFSLHNIQIGHFSIAVRNCEDCKLMCASQQFRTRDCKRLDLYLCCPTHPAIESCCSLRFSCFSANYPQLKGNSMLKDFLNHLFFWIETEQFEKANLNTLNNNWSHVYDFSLDEQQKHWTVVPPVRYCCGVMKSE